MAKEEITRARNSQSQEVEMPTKEEKKYKHYKVVFEKSEPRERETITFHPVGDGRWVAE